MASGWTRWLALGGTAAAAAAVTSWLVTRAPAAPEVSPAQARVLLPVADAYLTRHTAQLYGTGYLASKYPALTVRDFCTIRIIEVRRAGPRWLVGLSASCGEFARRGGTLLEGTGGDGNAVLTLTRDHGRYRAAWLAVSPPYPDQAWVAAHFSAGAAAELDADTAPMTPYPVSQARRAFGLSPTSPAISG